MKRELVNFIATIGLVLLGAAVVLGLLVGILFIFPNTTIFGAKSVNERDTQIVYRDTALVDAFAHGKLILESTGAKIEVKMSNQDYTGENTIVVNESATGIAFNSLSRTLIEWTQTQYNGELYYRLKVLEPSGIVFNQKPTTIYINLPHRAPTDDFNYDFVLQNRYSAVDFSFVDTRSTDADALRIGNLVVESAASVNIPSSKNISVKNVTIKSDNTNFTCQAPVAGNVAVAGSHGSQTFSASIGGNVTVTGSHGSQTFNSSIGGSVTIKDGNNNHFHGNRSGVVNFENAAGSLTMNDVQKLTVNTTHADIAVNHVENGVTMTTRYGDLWVDTIDNGGLNFAAGNANNPDATATVTVNEKVTGTAIVNNYGTGQVNLFGVNGNVSVNSCQVGGASINVEMQGSTAHSVTILGYDGKINVAGINGKVDIQVRDGKYGAGAANIYAKFNRVVGTENRIEAGGYVSGHDDWGNVKIELASGCNNFDLYVFGARSAKSSAKYGYTDKNMKIIEHDGSATADKANYINVSGGDERDSTLSVYSSNQVLLY
ncbi:MAG: DUF4097 family beta strand repeat-containing protein [Prevotella sp.]|nr:DUF4097 family beta strand repeat-containing protein [Prevotella sp.]